MPPKQKRARPNAVPYQLREWSRRAEIVTKVLTMKRRGLSLRAASDKLGEPIANLSRYVRAFRAIGMKGLLPEISKGRRSLADTVAITEAEAREIAALSTKVVHRTDIREGCKAYAQRPDCRPELRAALCGRLAQSVRKTIQSHLSGSGK